MIQVHLLLAERLNYWRQQHRERLLSVLTLLLVFLMFVAAPLQATGLVVFQGLSVLSGFLIIVAALVVSRSAVAFAAMLLAFIINVTVAVLRLIGMPLSLDLHLTAGSWFIIGVVLGTVVARVVFGPGKVTYHRIVGAVLLYLLIALVFVSLYLTICLIFPGAINGVAIEDTPALASRVIYFSFATLTTTGYGDMVPVHPLARSLCNLEAVIGQIYPATLLARIVTLELEQGR